VLQHFFHEPGGSLRDGWKAALFALGAIACDGAAASLRQALPPGLQESPWLPPPLFAALAYLALTWFCLELEGLPLSSAALVPDRTWARQWAIGMGSGVLLILCTVLPMALGGGVRLIRNPHGTLAMLLTGTWFHLGVAAAEELLFRGYLFQRLARSAGSWSALAVTSLLFTAVHLGNPGMTGTVRTWACLNIALAGLALGLCRLGSRSLAMPFGLHLGWNWAQGMLLGFGVSGFPSSGWWAPVFLDRPRWFTGGRFGLEASLPCTLVVTAACCWLVRWCRLTDRPNSSSQMDDLLNG
jgi:hypothetical protein